MKALLIESFVGHRLPKAIHSSMQLSLPGIIGFQPAIAMTQRIAAKPKDGRFSTAPWQRALRGAASPSVAGEFAHTLFSTFWALHSPYSQPFVPSNNPFLHLHSPFSRPLLSARTHFSRPARTRDTRRSVPGGYARLYGPTKNLRNPYENIPLSYEIHTLPIPSERDLQDDLWPPQQGGTQWAPAYGTGKRPKKTRNHTLLEFGSGADETQTGLGRARRRPLPGDPTLTRATRAQPFQGL